MVEAQQFQLGRSHPARDDGTIAGVDPVVHRYTGDRGVSPRKVEGPSHTVDASGMALRIADFLVRTEVERLALFRLHLRATVICISPLLLELALLEGIALTDAVALIHPPQDWPWRPLYDPPAPARMFLQGKSLKRLQGSHDVARFRRAFENPGVVVRDADHPRGRFAIRPCGSILAFTAAIGPCLLSAFGSSAMLKLPGPLPATLMMAMAGRTIGGIIDHPALAAGDYTVRRVEPDLADGLPVIMFRAPPIAFEMPWVGPTGRDDGWSP